MYMKRQYSFIFLGILLLSFSVFNPAHGHEKAPHKKEPVESNYEGDVVLIPHVGIPPALDGNILAGEYPEAGVVELEKIETTLFLSHNGTHLFAGIKFKGRGAGGIGIKQVHDQGEESGEDSLFTYIIGLINKDGIQRGIFLSNERFKAPFGRPEHIHDVTIRGQESGGFTTLELTTPISTGSIFQVVAIVSDDDEIPPADFSWIGVIPAYPLREGEIPDEIREILANHPDWIDAIGFPLLLFITAAATIWAYWPEKSGSKRKKESGNG